MKVLHLAGLAKPQQIRQVNPCKKDVPTDVIRAHGIMMRAAHDYVLGECPAGEMSWAAKVQDFVMTFPNADSVRIFHRKLNYAEKEGSAENLLLSPLRLFDAWVTFYIEW